MGAVSRGRPARCLLAGGEDAGRVEGDLDAFDDAAESGVVGVVLVGDEVHEGGVACGRGHSRHRPLPF